MKRNQAPFFLLLALALTVVVGALPAEAVNIVINNVDPPGVGFNDPTPKAPVGGNPGTTLGQQRLIAFQFAADLWGSILESDVDVVIQATFQPLTCSATAAVLGQAGAIQIFANFPGAPLVDTWYHVALANKLAGVDLAPGPPDPGFLVPPFNDDLVAIFNSSLDNVPACLGGIGWYYGLDNNHGAQIALVNVLLHELGHGLGFANFVTETSGTSPAGLPDVYSSNTLDITTGKLWNQMTTAEIQASALNCSNVVWNGANVTANVPRFLGPGLPAMTINAPGALAGSTRVGPATFGPALTSPGVTGNVVLVNDGVPPLNDGCEPLAPGSLSGQIALIDRGLCGFVQKVQIAQDAGAIAVLIADNVNACPPAGLGGAAPTITIPSARITLAEGNAIKAALPGVNATLGVNLSRIAGADVAGRAQLFATNPVQSGSSISHFDNIAFPNLLMEPSINADLPLGVDLTAWQMVDIGWTLATVVIDGCDTGVPNIPIPGNGTIGTIIDACAAAATNHGKFVSCVSHAMNDLKKAGLITGSQKGAIQSCAGQANIP